MGSAKGGLAREVSVQGVSVQRGGAHRWMCKKEHAGWVQSECVRGWGVGGVSVRSVSIPEGCAKGECARVQGKGVHEDAKGECAKGERARER